MKILQINAVPNGSTGTLAMKLHIAAAPDHQSLFMYSYGSSDVPDTVLVGTPELQKCHSLLSRITGLQGYWSFYDTIQMLRLINRFQPDVIHLHNLHANNINFPLFFYYIRKKKIPLCITLHDCFFFTGHCCHYTDVDCTQWQSECRKCPHIHDYNKSWFFDTSQKLFRKKKKWLTGADRLAVIGVSRWIAEESRKSFLQDEAFIDYIYNWIDRRVFYPREVSRTAETAGKFILLGVSQTWNDNKGLDDFIRLSRLLSPDEIILLVGTCSVKLPENIICIGNAKNAEEMALQYSAADVFVNLSKQETFGLVTAEALSCGTPAIVFNNTASPELIGPGCGFVCENGNIEQVLHAARQIKNTGKGIYRDACVRFAAENFDETKNIGKYFKIYQKLSTPKYYI